MKNKRDIKIVSRIFCKKKNIIVKVIKISTRSTVGNGRPHKGVCSTNYQEALIFNLSLKTNRKALHY